MKKFILASTLLMSTLSFASSSLPPIQNEAALKAITPQPTLIYIHADWCSACKQFGPTYDKFVSSKKVVNLKINGDDQQWLSAYLRAKAYPALYMVNKGKVTGSAAGILTEKELQDLVAKIN